jgi:hypothetical protein
MSRPYNLPVHSHRCPSCELDIPCSDEFCVHVIDPICKECHVKLTSHMDPRLNVLSHINEDWSEEEAFRFLFPNEAPKWYDQGNWSGITIKF